MAELHFVSVVKIDVHRKILIFRGNSLTNTSFGQINISKSKELQENHFSGNIPKLKELRDEISLLSNAHAAYTRKRGAGVKNYSLLGEGEETSPLQALLEALISRGRRTRFELDRSIRPESQTSIHHGMRGRVSSFQKLMEIAFSERLINTITRLLDDRASMLRRGGDEVSLLTATGACLLLQDINDSSRILDLFLNRATKQPSITAHSILDTKSSINLNIPKSDQDANNSLIPTNNPLTKSKDTLESSIITKEITIKPRISRSLSLDAIENMTFTDVNKNDIYFLFGREQIIRIIHFWINRRDENHMKSPISSDAIGYFSDQPSEPERILKGCGLYQLRERVENGLTAVLRNSVQARLSKILKGQYFLVHHGRSFHVDQFSPVVPEQKRVNPLAEEEIGPVEDLCRTILNPLLEQARRLCQPHVLHRVLSVAVNAVLEALLSSILDKSLHFNEAGVAVLFLEINIILRWVVGTKVELKIPSSCPLVIDSKPWERADEILQILQATCSGVSITSPTEFIPDKIDFIKQLDKIKSDAANNNNNDNDEEKKRNSSLFRLPFRFATFRRRTYKSNSQKDTTTAALTTNVKTGQHTKKSINNHHKHHHMSSPGARRMVGKKQMLQHQDQLRWATLAQQSSESGGLRMGISAALGRLVPPSLRFSWRRRKGVVSGSLELDLSLL